MIYTLICPDCGEITEFSMGMNDGHIAVDCPSCSCGMTRRENRCYGMDNFDIRGETVAGSKQVCYNYMDPTLGYIKNRQDRKDKMEARGLVDYEPNPKEYKHRLEAQKIKRQANPAGDTDADSAILTERKAAQTVRTKAGIKRTFDNAPQLVVTD